jgi:predicted transposase YdaD
VKDIDQDDQELIMKLSEMYEQLLEELKEQKRQEGRQEGLEQGREQGEKRERRAMVESILQVRFGEVDAELAKIVDKVVNISREEFTPLLLQLSREELLARFRN